MYQPFLNIEAEVIETEQTIRRIVSIPIEGDIRHFACTKFPIKNEKGELYRIGNITIEVTDQIEAENAARRQAQVIENVTEGVMVVDMDGAIVDWNQGAESLFGYTRAEIVGRTTQVLHAEEVPGTTKQAITRAIQKSGQWNAEIDCLHKDGTPITVEAWITVFNDENGVPIGTVGVNRDVTERKHTEDELERYRDHLEELVAERSKEVVESEQQLRLLADSLPPAIAYTDSEDKFQFVNRAFCTWFNVDRSQTIGKQREDVLSAFVDEQTYEAFQKARSGKAVTIEKERDLDTLGHQIVQLTLIPDMTEDGLVKGVYSLANDITEIRNAEKAIRASEMRLSGILRIAPEAIISVDENQTIQMFNEGAEHIFGYEAGEVVGNSLNMLIPERFHDRHIRMVDDFSESPGQVHRMTERVTIWGLRKCGSEFPAAASISKLDFEDHPLFTVILRDITEHKKTQSELITAKEAAEAGNRAKSEFLAMVSHELRTPLNAILGFTQILQKGIGGRLNGVQGEYVTAVHDSGTHLLNLINDILDLSKLEAGKTKLEESRVFVPSAVDQMLLFVRERASEGRITIEETVPDDLPLLYADERMLKQMMLNLLSNAVKFTPAEGKVVVSTKTHESGDLLISVSDTGIGMRPENIVKALSTFGQIDSDLNRKHEGTGLGLPLVKSLIELHGGELMIESEEKVGTTFTLSFPRERVIERSSISSH